MFVTTWGKRVKLKPGMLLNTLQMHQTVSTTIKDYPAPNANSVQVEKSWSKLEKGSICHLRWACRRGKKDKVGKITGKKILTDGSEFCRKGMGIHYTVCYPGGTFPSFIPKVIFLPRSAIPCKVGEVHQLQQKQLFFSVRHGPSQDNQV